MLERISGCCRPSANSCSGTDDGSEEVRNIRIMYRKMLEKEIIEKEIDLWREVDVELCWLKRQWLVYRENMKNADKRTRKGAD